MGKGWTHDAKLPGGDVPADSFADWQQQVQIQYPWLPAALCQRLTRAYGYRIHGLLEHCHQLADLGRSFGADLYQREVEFLIQQEWARSAEDIVWRRSKLGLHLNSTDIAQLQHFITDYLAQHTLHDLESTPALRQAG